MIQCRTRVTDNFFASPAKGDLLLIAEAGVGHFGDIERGFRLIDLAVEGGFDVVKFQHFAISELVSEEHSPEWYERLGSRTLADAEVVSLAEYAHQKGIAFACTAHEPLALKFIIENLDVAFFKFGSGEWRTRQLLGMGANTDKPLIISTGMHSRADVENLCNWIDSSGITSRVILMNCVTSYPTPLFALNLGFLRDEIYSSKRVWGHSDHCESEIGCFASIALGACVIERHISLEAEVPNAQDWKVSTFAATAKRFVTACRELARARKEMTKPLAEEIAGRQWACKSPYFTKSLKDGEQLKKGDVKFLRPYQGISEIEFEKVLGSKLKRSVSKGEPFTWDLVT